MPPAVTGRLATGPSQVVHDEILLPQFRYEMRHLLPWYLLIEKILVLEYERLRLLPAPIGREIATLLHEIDADRLDPDSVANLSDPALAIERYVEARLSAPAPFWHVDRSRNDLQASAQLMAARHRLLRVIDGMLVAADAAVGLAARFTDAPMPGYTQGQAAQVTTPGFHLAALTDQLLWHTDRLVGAFDAANLSPLGAGAMAGQEIGFDRAEMARLAGFAGVQPHALVAVASRGWALEISAALSIFGVTLSRLLTDMQAWGGSDRGWLTVPDTLAGISSAMPQKRNMPVLERLRGKTGHLVSGYIDVAVAQRNTPFTNMVEVSKESTAGLIGLFDTADTVLRLLAAVLTEAGFDADRMRASCEGEFLGGFTLANRLTLRGGIPWRTAQVIAGRYIRRCSPPAVRRPMWRRRCYPTWPLRRVIRWTTRGPCSTVCSRWTPDWPPRRPPVRPGRSRSGRCWTRSGHGSNGRAGRSPNGTRGSRAPRPRSTTASA